MLPTNRTIRRLSWRPENSIKALERVRTIINEFCLLKPYVKRGWKAKANNDINRAQDEILKLQNEQKAKRHYISHNRDRYGRFVKLI